MPIDNDGSSLGPTFSFLSETSLGFFRSASSSMALSYGTLKIAPSDRPESLAMWHTGSGNWRIGKVGSNTGALTLSTDSGTMAVGAGIGAQLILQSNNGVTRFTVQSGGTTEFAASSFVTAGTAVSPGLGFNSELSLGLFRSAASTMALSYGTWSFNQAYIASVKTATSVSSAVLGTDAWAVANPAVSGASICININGVMYIFNSSATTIGK